MILIFVIHLISLSFYIHKIIKEKEKKVWSIMRQTFQFAETEFWQNLILTFWPFFRKLSFCNESWFSSLTRLWRNPYECHVILKITNMLKKCNCIYENCRKLELKSQWSYKGYKYIPSIYKNHNISKIIYIFVTKLEHQLFWFDTILHSHTPINIKFLREKTML